MQNLDSWFDSSNSLLILVYQVRIYISHDTILRACTKIYRNNSGNLISDSRITKILLAVPLDTWSHRRDSESWRAPRAVLITHYPLRLLHLRREVPYWWLCTWVSICTSHDENWLLQFLRSVYSLFMYVYLWLWAAPYDCTNIASIRFPCNDSPNS